MPVALDPQQRLELVLKSDKKIPKAKRPTFVFRYLTGREWGKAASIFDSLQGLGSGSEAMNSVFDAVRIGLVGWRNMNKPDGTAIKFDPDELDAILTPGEGMELLSMVMDQTVPDAEDLGKSASQR